MYYVNGKRFEETSEANQKIISLFLQREQVHDMTTWVKYVISMDPDEGDGAPFTFEDMQKGYPATLPYACPECGSDMGETPFRIDMAKPIYYDVSDKWECPVCGMLYGDKLSAEYCCAGVPVYWCADCGTVLNENDICNCIIKECEERNEWWMVSDWLGAKLAERGAYIISADGMKLWGRSFNGEDNPLTTDVDICAICSELEILEGQKHAWPVQ